jgi:DNA helicase-2/ATP-dependent DNA helicase PcrA
MATLSLVHYCYELAHKIVGRQLEFLNRHRLTAEKFRRLYGELYTNAYSRLYAENEKSLALADELRYAYRWLREQGRIEEIAKLSYIINYVEIDLLTPASGSTLAEQLGRHMPDLCTMKEADLCGAASMEERVFVSTVHKAKGLEFDNVIVYDAVEGKFPSAYADTTEKSEEEARKFYVAISRARRRLVVGYCHQSINRWGRLFPKSLTRYMAPIRHAFG